MIEIKVDIMYQVPGGTRCICSFTQDNSLVAVCADGAYHKFIQADNKKFVADKYQLFLDIKT